MNEIMTIMVLDAIMVGLLIVTIIYCFKVNSRIKTLQDSKSEFKKLIEKFDATTSRAQQSIEELQTVSSKVNAELSTRLDKANFLADDLAFMIERGGKVVNKMENGVTAKSASSQATAPSSKQASRPVSSSAKRSASASESVASAKDNKRASLESILSKSSARKSAKAKKPTVNARLRSRAEQELFEAINTEE